MDIAQKGIEGLLGTISKVYRSSIAAAFRPKLTTNNSH
jgi:hypothetical protein